MKVSVIIPTRDRADLLARTLRALALQQSTADFEVVVVDNGSTDHTAEVLAQPPLGLQLQALHEPVPNRARARNRGIAVALGGITIFIDDDVLVPPHFVQAHVAAHELQKSRVVSGPIMNVANVDETAKPRWYNHSRAFFCTCNVSVETAALRAVGAFDEGFHSYGWEDTELGVRLRQSGIQRIFAWDAYVYHLKPPGWETLAQAETRMREKGRMARRFVAKSGGWRVRLATGDHAVNHLRGALLGAPWTMPIARTLAESDNVPAVVQALARGHYLDGTYRAALRGDERGAS